MISDCRKTLECDQERQHPDLTDQAKQKTLINLLRDPGDPQQIDDEDDIGGNAEKVRFKGSEARCFKVQG